MWRDGFLYNSDNRSELDRLLAGEPNLIHDDPFSIVVEEANNQLYAAEAEERKAEARLAQVRGDIARLRKHKQDVEKAVQHFRDTGEIDDALLPACQQLIAKELAPAIEAEKLAKAEEIKGAEAKLTKCLNEHLDGTWEFDHATTDETHVYVTVKLERKCPAPISPSKENVAVRVIARVKEAFETYRLDFVDPAIPRVRSSKVSPRGSP